MCRGNGREDGQRSYKGMRANQVTCNPAAPCSHQAGLRTYKAQLHELKPGRAFPLSQWLPLPWAMAGVQVSLITVAGAVQDLWKFHSPASRFILWCRQHHRTPVISMDLTPYLCPKIAEASKSDFHGHGVHARQAEDSRQIAHFEWLDGPEAGNSLNLAL